MFWCDNRCSEKALSFWQFASVVLEDGEESDTANLCQRCCNKKLVAKGGAPLKNWQWCAVVEKKAHRGRLWRMLVRDQHIQGLWKYFPVRDWKERSFGRMPRRKNWEELHLLTSKEISVEVEHVLAHRTEKGQERYVAF